ncbi:MAG: hypothetical protein FJ303_20245 [Planctomycetes bacterium]|nr:hypothetical protein [Planctomycetota bacterium]
MKKMFVAGLLALAAVALTQHQASAWTNHRFSIGLSWNRQAGGNSLGWGAWRNGQPPGPETFHFDYGTPHHHHHHGHSYAPAPVQVPTAYTPAPEPTVTYPSPYQFATYPQEAYYYPTPYYYYGR